MTTGGVDLEDRAPEADPDAPGAAATRTVQADPDVGFVAGGPEYDPDRAYQDAVAEQLRLSRLRLYSYCMTLSACVLALMTFMYLVQGIGDGDGTFTGIGVMFAGATVLMLWGALRVTQLGDRQSA